MVTIKNAPRGSKSGPIEDFEDYPKEHWIDLREYRDVFMWTEDVLEEQLRITLRKLGYKKIAKGDMYLYAPGKDACLCIAHLDTVHEGSGKWVERRKKAPPRIWIDQDEGFAYSPDGIGGDDRNGVVAILEFLRRGLRPSILFTKGEETGCIGAKAFCRDYSGTFKNPKGPVKEGFELYRSAANGIIQVDRAGERHAVYYSCDGKNPGWETLVEKHGFPKEIGSSSDVRYVAETLEICGVNFASGYYENHTLKEYVDIAELSWTISHAESMMRELIKLTPFKWKPTSWNSGVGDSSYLGYPAPYYGKTYGTPVHKPTQSEPTTDSPKTAPTRGEVHPRHTPCTHGPFVPTDKARVDILHNRSGWCGHFCDCCFGPLFGVEKRRALSSYDLYLCTSCLASYLGPKTTGPSDGPGNNGGGGQETGTAAEGKALAIVPIPAIYA